MGLKFYLSVYKNEPRIQTLIPVKAGGKFDPENSTGLAHYLEHMMFKGNNLYGTKDWDKEKPLVDSIEQMFEHYRSLTDAGERKDWYEKIDQVSNEAAKYAIANEYDKMVQYIGATGTNAYTTEDRTVYVNNIPGNQVENWLQIESARFKMILNRLFHTELEAVYEEKNRSLDNDNWKVYENLYKAMFKKHKYGTQTVIGTIEHLKNPSITDINAYFYKYYVPNNMAICMSGDLDPDETIALIDNYFGEAEPKEIEPYVKVVEDPITSPREVTIIGPDAEKVTMGFRFDGTSSDDIPYLNMVDFILANSMAGLIDLNLVQKQKVLGGSCYVDQLNDYSIHTFYGNPREGQSLDEVKDLLLSQIELVKKGEFEDWLMDAIINDFKKSRMKGLESNYARVNNMITAFTNDMTWQESLSMIPRMEAITKEQLVEFANKHYGNNYVVIYKRNGEDENKKQVDKPTITKVDVDRATRSDFFQAIADNDIPKIKPSYINYEEDLEHFEMKSSVPVIYKKNVENDLFTLYYLLETGTNENPMLKYALNYLEYLGTETKTAEEIKKEFYRLGCSFSVFSSNDRVYVYLNGLQENMVEAMILFEDLLQNPKPDKEVMANMITDAHKSRSDAKKSKNTILWQGLMNYSRYGKDNPFTNVVANDALNALQEQELIGLIKSMQTSEHKVMYYGPMSTGDLKTVLNDNHRVPDQLTPVPKRKDFQEMDASEPQVYWTNYDMVQAEIMFQSRGPKYDKKLSPEARMFNAYFGGMSGIAFQEIREAQGLAYSVFTSYSQGRKEDKNDFLMAYVGTQADKQEEAMDAMINLLNEMPESQQTFDNAKKGILEKIESQRITKTGVLFNYLNAKEKGLDYDIRKDIYTRVKDMTFSDLKTFHDKYVKDKKFNVALIGDKGRLDFAALSKYGEVNKLSLEEIFGYDDHLQKVLN